ncbi:MAG: 30S ribosomal protein S27ae [Nitrososphaeraceae archaeon]
MADKKKQKDSQVYKFFNVQSDKVERIKRDCPRCGKGVFMAAHKDRYTCGKCGFTEFIQKK